MENLVVEYQAGRMSSFDELYRRSWRRVFNVCLRSTSDHHAAEELAQETFTRAWQGLAALDGERHWDAWVHRIATRVCIDASRRRVVTAQLVDDLPSCDDAGSVSESPAALVALGRLPRDQRVAFELVELEGWSRRRVAREMTISPGRVESLVLQARRQLRERLAAGEAPRPSASA